MAAHHGHPQQVMPGRLVDGTGVSAPQFRNAAQARAYQQQQLQQQQHLQHQQQMQMQMQMQAQGAGYQHQAQMMPPGTVLINGYPSASSMHPTAGTPYSAAYTPGPTHYIDPSASLHQQPVAGPSHIPVASSSTGQQTPVVMHRGEAVQMAVPPGMTLQPTSQGRMIVVPLPVPVPGSNSVSAHPDPTPGHSGTPHPHSTPRPQGTPMMVQNSSDGGIPTHPVGEVLTSALSQAPLEHPTTGVGGHYMMAGDPNAHPDGIVMIDGQAYSARAVREQQMMHRQMVLQQQQEEQLKQHELNMRQREMDDEEDEQAEAELRMQAMQRQAQIQMQAQARAQQQHVLVERERERAVQAQQEQHRTQQLQMQQQQQLQQARIQAGQESPHQQMMAAPGQQTPSQAGNTSTPQQQSGQFQAFRAHPHMSASPVVPVQTESQIQQMREMQAQQMREVQMRHQSQLQQEMQQRQQHGQEVQQGRTQITKAEAMAMRDRERQTILPSARPAEMGLRTAPVDSGRIVSTPMPMGPPAPASSIAQSARSAAQSQAGSAVRLAQMQLQAGLGLGIPLAPQKRDTSEQPSPAGYPPPRAISMVVYGDAGQGTPQATGSTLKDVQSQRGSVVPSGRNGQERVGQSVERGLHAQQSYASQLLPSGITIGLEDDEGVVTGIDEDPGMLVHPAMTFGQATLKMMQFFERLKQASETVSVIPYQMLIEEFFLDDALLDLTLIGQESREFELPRYLLPRFFNVIRDLRAVRTAWNIASPRETYVEDPDLPPPVAEGSPQGVALESSSLSWAKYLSNGAVVITHGACRAIWTMCPRTDQFKMHRFELALRANDDLVFRSAIEVLQQTPRTGAQLQVRMENLGRDGSTPPSTVRERNHVKIEENLGDMIPLCTPPISIGSSKSDQSPFHAGGNLQTPRKTLEIDDPRSSRQHSYSETGEIVVEDPRERTYSTQHQGAVKVNIPANPLDQYGMSADALRFLDLASTFLSMMPLIDLSSREKISPRVALQQYVARDRAGVGPSSRLLTDPGSTPRMETPHMGSYSLQQESSGEGLQPAPSHHPGLSIRTTNLTPTPVFTSAFTTTPLSTHPPPSPHDLSAHGPNSLTIGASPWQSTDDHSRPSASPHPAQNGTQLQQSKLKRKLDRSLDSHEEEAIQRQPGRQQQGAAHTGPYGNPAKRVAQSPRNPRARGGKNE